MSVAIKVSEQLKVRVFNEDRNVFEGTIKEFIEINEHDELTINFVNGLESKEIHEEYFAHSGYWKIEKL